MRLAIAVAVLMAALVAAPPANSQESLRRIFDYHGGVTSAGEEGDALWLTVWTEHVRFRIEGDSKAKRDELAFLLRRAEGGSRSTTLRFDGSRGRVNRETGTLDYPLCGIVLDDLRYAPSKACDESPVAAPEGPEAALARAAAHLGSSEFGQARELLARSDFPADPAFRKILLSVRASAAEGLALEAPRGSMAGDQALMAALADSRALAALEPDDIVHRLSIAEALKDLGAYDEAKAEYEAMLRQWPDEDYRVTIALGALHRVQGDYAKALDTLNRLVVRHGRQEGMKFHYHRAWTLSLLGRHDEAIADLTEGLRTQPDYSSAYHRRACAFAAVGQLGEALDDVVEAGRLYAAIPGAATSTFLKDDMAGAAALRARLEAARAAGVKAPVPDACAETSWSAWEKPRPRSPLLAGR